MAPRTLAASAAALATVSMLWTGAMAQTLEEEVERVEQQADRDAAVETTGPGGLPDAGPSAEAKAAATEAEALKLLKETETSADAARDPSEDLMPEAELPAAE